MKELQKGKTVYFGACAQKTECVPNELVTRKAHRVTHVAFLSIIQNLAACSRKQNQGTSNDKGTDNSP